MDLLPPKGAKWTEAPRIVQKLNYRADRQGFIEDGNTHIFLLSADNGGTPHQLTSGAYNHGAPHWMPDGKSIVFGGSDKSVRVIDATSGEQTFFSLLHDDRGFHTPGPRWDIYEQMKGIANDHSNSMMTSSTLRLAPASAAMVLTRPRRSALRIFSIFIASTVASA